jgi:hypothetical protein
MDQTRDDPPRAAADRRDMVISRQTDIGHGDLRSSGAVRKDDWREEVAGQVGGVFRFTEKRYSVRFVLILPLPERCKRYLWIAA